MKTLWLLAFFVVAASVYNTESSFPPGSESDPDGYWFGTHNLLCMILHGKFKRSAPTRPTYELSHRLIYYNGTVYDREATEDKIIRDPNWPEALQCPVSWEKSPAGYSNCSVELVDKFVTEYSDRYGEFNVITNNCHHFANRISQFLYDSNCGRNGLPE